MKTLVVYDSKYGNTEIIARAIAGAIPGDTTLLHVSEVQADELGGFELLIVGGPTHGGGASESAKEVLESIPASALVGVNVAAFDTRLTWWWIRPFGFAAPKIAKSLQKKGGTLIVAAEGFSVTGGEGPLADGEVERAAVWAKEIAALVAQGNPHDGE